MKTARHYDKLGFSGKTTLTNLHSNFSDLSDLSNVNYSNLVTYRKGYSNVADDSLVDNKMSSADGALTPSEIQAIYKSSGSKLDLQAWLKTDSAKGAIAYATHKKSGSTKSFGEWLQSDSGKQVLTTATLLAVMALGGNNASNNQTQPPYSPPSPLPEDSKTETTILGMSPVTFGLVSIVLLTGAIFGVKAILKNK